jgi:hypothetical protein
MTHKNWGEYNMNTGYFERANENERGIICLLEEIKDCLREQAVDHMLAHDPNFRVMWEKMTKAIRVLEMLIEGG